MEQYLFAGMNPQDRRTHLEAEASKVVEGEPYDRPLDEAELEQHKNDLLSTLEKIDATTDEKAAVLSDFKRKLDAFKATLTKLKTELRTGHTRTVGTLYYIPDYDTRKMRLYNADGYLVSQRGLLPEERQQNIFLRRAAND